MEGSKIERVLAAVDFSGWTESVLATAAEMARRYQAKLTVIYAEIFMPPPYFTERGVERIADFLKLQKEAALQQLKEVAAAGVGDGVEVETRLVEASPVEGILRTTEQVGAGLIVMGTHGRSGLNRLLLGSVAEKVLRTAEVPVLTVRGIGEEESHCRLPFRRILCPVNYSPVAEEALRHAADLGQRFGAELVLMTSLEEEAGSEEERREHERRLCAGVPEEVQHNCALKPAVRAGNAAEQILRMAAEEECDLIVIGAQHRPLLETKVIGTTSVRVMRHAPCPVLTVSRHADD